MKFALLAAAVAADCSVVQTAAPADATNKKTCVAATGETLATATYKAPATVGTKTGTCTAYTVGGVTTYYVFSECTAAKTATINWYTDTACATAATTAKNDWKEGCDATTGNKYAITNPSGAMLIKGTAVLALSALAAMQ